MRLLAASTLTALLLGCNASPTGVDGLGRSLPLPEQPLRVGQSARRVGSVDTGLVALPTLARAGESLKLRVPVALSGCVGSDTTVVSVDRLDVTIVPYQQVLLPALNIACPDIYTLEVRTVRVTLVQPGEARVRLVSRGGPDGGLFTIERRITVQ